MFPGARGRMLHPMLACPTAPPTTAPARERLVTARHESLPVRVTPLIGRVGELAELDDLLLHERTVTLTGSGGCGKTRLALELAHRIAPRFDGGVLWVELASCADGDTAVAELAAVLDVLENPGEVLTDGIVRALRGRGASLVVLDNAEHVLDAVAALAATLTGRVEQARVVCTSREPLGVPGEVVWRVPSLAVPTGEGDRPPAPDQLARFEAVQLFVERARRARRGFALTPANAAAVAQICVRLDGVPLALELAAARVRTMPPERIADQLDDRFRLLAGGPRTLVARQQTLQASVAWSEGLLDDGERRVFRRLGVFAGGFTVEAAEAVVGAFGDIDAYQVADTLGRLVDKSLVQLHEDGDRSSLLDTIRTYALQRLLEEGELAAARDAHADWCVAWLTAVTGDEGDDVNAWWAERLAGVARIDPEWANCVAALDWVVPGSSRALALVRRLGDYWALRQRANDSGRYGMPVLRAADHDDPAWLEAVLALQAVRTNAADVEYADIRATALARAEAIGDRRAQLRLQLGHHIASVMLFGPRGDVLRDLDAVRDEAVALGEWYTAWNAMQSPAVMMAVCGRAAEAEARVAPLTSARASLVRAIVALTRGDLSGAAEHASTARREGPFRAAMDRILATFLAAGSALATGDEALLAPLRLDERSTMALPRPFVSAFAMARGAAQVLHGELGAAAELFRSAPLDLFTSWLSLVHLAQIELALGDADAASASARRLQEMIADVPAPLYDAASELVLAECAWPHDHADALERAHRALATAADDGLDPLAVDALEAVGALWLDAGRERDAARVLAAADAARDRGGYRFRHAHRRAYVGAATGALAGSEGWAEGRDLALADAVELARRGRGERLRPVSGWGSLTPTERRVVDLVATGRTNPAIAEALLMSRATVKTHLVHVYAKLGVATRAELAALVARRGEP